ncbi:MAG: hypothetical protein HYR89_06570 [Actinobacteria bacterium]|nr:hypothetical protein [Actinomycetota bacterium]
MTVDQRIQLVLKGSRTSDGAVDFDALLAFGDAFRKALRALVRSRAGQPAVQAGQPGAEVREASSLRLIGLRAGSAVLELEPIDARLLADPVVDALQSLADGLAGQGAFEPPVVGYLREAVQSLGEQGSVGLRVPERSPVDFDEAALDRLATTTTPPPAAGALAPGTVDGWLHAIDIDPDEVRIRDTAGRDWSCHYPEQLESQVRELIGRVVRASGMVRTSASRSRIELAAIEGVEPASASQRRSKDEILAQAMRDASVVAPQPLAGLAGDIVPTDDDELAFEEALQAIK